MLITNQSNTYLIKRMETFETAITPVRRNVARKSTANRPLLNTIIKDPLELKKNEVISDVNIISRSNTFTNYPAFKSSDFSLYYKDNVKNTPKTFMNEGSKKYSFYDIEHEKFKYNGNSDTSFMQVEAEEDEDISGVFSVSDAMTKYLSESILSPQMYQDSSDESIDLSRVKNYPVKLEKCCKNEKFPKPSSINNENISPPKESGLDTGKSIKQESVCESNVEEKVQPVIVIKDSLISDDSCITDLGTQTKKCLFDPDLESVTCKIKVREEVLVCENVPLKMTILESNFDVDQLENKVEEGLYNLESECEKDDMSIVPQVICAMSLGNVDNNGLGEKFNLQAPEKPKKGTKKPKKVTLKSSEIKTEFINTVNEKRFTRSQMQVNNTIKRVTRNSIRLNSEPVIKEEYVQNEVVNFSDGEQDNESGNKDLSVESSKLPNNSAKNEFIDTEKNVNNFLDSTNVEKSECSKKKCTLDKKGKKEINEGVLLHVEATKETELMKDGKIIKDKEEFLKDIESKIDQNLPVVVEKEFDIHQSLTEEILLDQALRLAHQRTSPRLSKIMKEAILKASVQKQNSKAKQSKVDSNKTEVKQKGIKSNIHRNKSEESETTDSVLNSSTSSESASDVPQSLDSSISEIDKKSEEIESQQKRKKENYIVTPVIKQSNVVEPLTIKICRKTNKKKTGFRLSSKKKKSPKKKENGISKPICSNAVNMDDLSKTFEDILQDDNWCSGDKLSNVNIEDLAHDERNMHNSSVPSSSDGKDVNGSENLCDQRKCKSPVIDIVHSTLNTSSKNINDVQSDDCNRGKHDNNKTDKPLSHKPEVITNKETGEQFKFNNNTLSDSNICVNTNSKEEDSNDSSIPLLGDTDFCRLNKNSSLDSKIFSSSTVINNNVNKNIGNDKNDEVKSCINLEQLSPSQSSIISSATVNSIGQSVIDSSSSLKLNKSPLSPVLDTSSASKFSYNTQLKTSNSFTAKPHLEGSVSENYLQTQTSPNELSQSYSLTLINDTMNRPLFSTNIVEKQTNQVFHQQNNSINHLDNQVVNKDTHFHQEQTLDPLKCPVATTNSDMQPKVLPLSIASRDPRLRKSHVRVIVEVSTSSVSNSLLDKPDIQQERRIISHVMESLPNEVGNRRDDDSGSEINENHVEIDRRKKLKKREVDAELLYKTPLSDLHDVPERSSYTRSIRKRSPPKNDKRDPRNIRSREVTFFPNPDRVPDTYREYHEINMIYSKISLHDPSRKDMVIPDEFNRIDGFSPDFRKIDHFRSDSHHPEQYNMFRNDLSPSDLRRENYVLNSSTEYIHEVTHTKEFSERHSSYQNLSEQRRLGFQYKEPEEECRHPENFPSDFVPSDIYARGYKRPYDFNVDHGPRESPSFREKEVGRERILERNNIVHNEPSYSRWDYAHKKVGHFPPVDNDSHKEEENSHPDEINMWEEERDLIDGPVKNFSRPYYRRKKFSRGEELFERRSAPWDLDNRRYNEDSDRNYERLWVRKTDNELIHGPERERWDRRGRKGFRDVREERSRSPRKDPERYTGKRSKSPGGFLKSRKEESPSPHNSPLVLDSPMSPEPADRICVIEPTKCLTVPQ